MKRLLLVPVLALAVNGAARAQPAAVKTWAASFATRQALLEGWKVLSLSERYYYLEPGAVSEEIRAGRSGYKAWRLRQDDGRTVLEGKGHATAIARPPGALSTDNLSVSVSLRIGSGAGGGILWGWHDHVAGETGYYVWVHPGRKHVALLAGGRECVGGG